MEVMYGLDAVDIDDEGLVVGMFTRHKDFLNIKNLRTIKGKVHEY